MRRTILTATAVAAAVVSLPGVASAAETTYVTPSDISATCSPTMTTTFCEYERGDGTAEIGPGIPDPEFGGTDHLLIDTPLETADPGNAKATVFGYGFAGQPLSAITTLGYRSFVVETDPTTPKQAPALNITIDSNGPATGGFATLVWEPVYTTESTVHGEWVNRSPSTSTGGWWSLQNGTTTGQVGALGFATYTASWADVQRALPNATVAGIGVNQGGGNPGLVGQVDLLQVNGTVYDFETVVPVKPLTPTTKQDCKAGVWTTFNAPTFRNQGECVSFLMSQRPGR